MADIAVREPRVPSLVTGLLVAGLVATAVSRLYLWLWSGGIIGPVLGVTGPALVAAVPVASENRWVLTNLIESAAVAVTVAWVLRLARRGTAAGIVRASPWLHMLSLSYLGGFTLAAVTALDGVTVRPVDWVVLCAGTGVAAIAVAAAAELASRADAAHPS